MSYRRDGKIPSEWKKNGSFSDTFSISDSSLCRQEKYSNPKANNLNKIELSGYRDGSIGIMVHPRNLQNCFEILRRYPEFFKDPDPKVIQNIKETSSLIWESDVSSSLSSHIVKDCSNFISFNYPHSYDNMMRSLYFIFFIDHVIEPIASKTKASMLNAILINYASIDKDFIVPSEISWEEVVPIILFWKNTHKQCDPIVLDREFQGNKVVFTRTSMNNETKNKETNLDQDNIGEEQCRPVTPQWESSVSDSCDNGNDIDDEEMSIVPKKSYCCPPRTKL